MSGTATTEATDAADGVIHTPGGNSAPFVPMEISSSEAAEILNRDIMTTFEWSTFLFGLRSLSPWMCDRMTEEQIEGLVTGMPPTFEKDEGLHVKAKRKLYAAEYDKDGMPVGDPVVPVENVYASLRDAGTKVKCGSGKWDLVTLSTQGTRLFGMVRFRVPHFKILGFNGQPAKWVVDTRKGNATQGNGAVGIIRPKFEQAGIVGYVDINVNAMTVDVAKELFTQAGIVQGLMSARPRCKMPFGQFALTAFTHVGGAEPRSSRLTSLPTAKTKIAKGPGRGKGRKKKNEDEGEGALVGTDGAAAADHDDTLQGEGSEE